MRPGARLQAAIDILSEFMRRQRPAEQAFDSWSRRSRFAGSKDRAAVAQIYFDVIRHRGLLDHALGADATPRLLVLASQFLHRGASIDDLAALSDGSAHAPSPLTEWERQKLIACQALDRSKLPLTARYNLPPWLEPAMREAFGSRIEYELDALQDRAPLDLRVNTLKCNRETARRRLAGEGIASEETPWSPWGLRIQDAASVTATETFSDGWVDIQDEGSQIAALITGAAPGRQAVDYCAGGGGKSLALSAMMDNRGQIYASDADRRRLDAMKTRIARAGVRNVQLLAPRPDADIWEDKYDRMDTVLVDAPCSGLGAIRRHPDAAWRLSPDRLDELIGLQQLLLDEAARLVAPGGRLVYVTCSVLVAENAAQAAAFLQRHPDFSPLDWRDCWPPMATRPPVQDGPFLTLTPASTATDGFFIALFQRHQTAAGSDHAGA